MIMPLADLTPTDRHLRPALDAVEVAISRQRSLSTVDGTGEIVDVVEEPSDFRPAPDVDTSEALDGEVVDEVHEIDEEYEVHEQAEISRVRVGSATSTSLATLARLLDRLKRL